MEVTIYSKCGSEKIKKNGHIHSGKQNHQCQECRRQFVAESAQKLISAETRNLLKKLLLERVSLRGICRAIGISLRWLLLFIANLYGEMPDDLNCEINEDVSDIIIEVVDAEVDELWSYVGKKENKQWVWIAMYSKTKQIIAFHVGDRSKNSVQSLWDKIPVIYRCKAIFHTDLLESYKAIIPHQQHQAISKLRRQTNHIERFNGTLRQRVSRLVHQTLSFSKKLDNHIGAIKYFICHYNLKVQHY